METKVNYTLVGLFVLLLGAALVAGILWLSAGGSYRQVYDIYLAYTSESVSGLNFEAPVKYRGVEVGRVKRISLDQGERVRLELEIERGTPIRTNTVAVLRVQGLTGVAYVELDGGTRDAPLLEARDGKKYPVIETGPSLLTRVDTAATDVLASLESVSGSINATLDEDNRKSFKKLLADLATLSGALVARKDTIESGLQDAARTAENTARASAELQRLIGRMDAGARALEKMSNDVSRLGAQTGNLVDNANDGVSRAKNELLPELEHTLAEARELSDALKRLGNELGNNPNMLLLGRQPPAPGPGEEMKK